MTDPIADMLTRIRNAFMAHNQSVLIPHSKLKEAIAKILKESGYINDYQVSKSQIPGELKVELKYVGKVPAITEIKRVSKPGRRVYSTAKKIPKALGGYGITIISTSQGLLTDDIARKKNLGGELIAQVW